MSVMQNQKGVTLIEMLLILIVSISLVMMLLHYTTQKSDLMRQDRLTMEIHQILNAASAYYEVNGQWPGSSTCQAAVGDALTLTHPLVSSGFLPNPPANWKVYGSGFVTCVDSATSNYYVVTQMPVPHKALGGVIASQLPSGITAVAPSSSTLPPFVGSFTQANCTTAAGSNNCFIISMVSIPGQNLNNARSVNFGSIYNAGQCVPVPTCPANMSPGIYVAPVSVSGTNDNNGSATPNVYPISSYTAYATNPAAVPATCPGIYNDNCAHVTGATQYWRVCLSVTTERGTVLGSNVYQDTKNVGSVVALTRCYPTSEPTGSTFNSYTP